MQRLASNLIASVVVFSAMLTAAAFGQSNSVASESPPDRNHWVGDGVVPSAWLKEKTTVTQAEFDHTPKPDGRSDPVLKKPFGYMSAKWQTFKNNMHPGDEIWTFSSPADSWRDLHGRAGIALVRNGIVVASILTMLN